MYNNNGERKMDKTILIVKVTNYQTIPDGYSIEATADNLEEASKYQVALKALNKSSNVTYELFNGFGQFEVEEIKKVVNDNK
tara:strand:+ start:437 stop:682 length:246 start_codon:yes stop_codon:yes gene_type:complete